MAEQVTTMVLKVNLKCDKCYKKVKKVLCKFPQIRDQLYDDKNDKVTIKVVCCSPEKIKEKIICKGGDSIKRIKIKVPEKTKPKPPEEEKPKPPPEKPPVAPPKPNPPPLVVCCRECYVGYPGGPCFRGHGGPPPCYQYNGYCGRPVYDPYGGGRNYCVSRCDYFSEENSAGCTVM